MNKIFKKIWSESRGCFVVVSETASSISRSDGKERKIEKLISEYRHNGIVLYVHDNGQPDYFDIKTMCDFAMVDFEEKDGEFVAILVDDGNKRVNIISVDQLEELVSKQIENRGNFYETKADALKDLNYMLNSENIGKDTYDELVQELNKLKI